ncbi:MAG: recombinase family protein [Oscillospiraceae bacterium]|nr:recombinase family protein [Oscillospiraceae bacterium]MCL2279529.1 recombinase family protein [Oscillospiraceae bacterium]
MARKSRKHLYDNPEPPSAEIQTLFNAAGYVRLSGNDKRKGCDSIETQRNIIENYIASSPGIRLSEIYSDTDKTGTNFDRPGFLRMMADIESGKINCIIVKDLSRFGRNAIDGGYYLERVLPTLGVRFIAITDGYDSLDGDGGILIGLKNIIAESYALDIGRKCRSVNRQNIADGRFIGRLAPYGYMKSPDDCHKLIIDEETAPTVRQMFRWAYSGISTCEITRRLSDSGIQSPGHSNYTKGLNSDKMMGVKYWKYRTVRQILTNRVYVGDMVQGKSQKISGKKVETDSSKWICVHDTHEPIISTDMFNAVQEKLAHANELAKSIKTEPFSENIFLGKIFCGGCGFAMKRKRQNKDGIYWFRCESQTKYGKGACTVVSVKEAELVKELLVMLRKQAEVLLSGCATIEKSADPHKFEAKLTEINKGLDKDGRMLKSLFENLMTGLIDQNEFVRMKVAYEKEIESLSGQADEVRNRQYEVSKKIGKYKNMLDAFLHTMDNEKFTSEIIGALVSEIKVSPDKSFDVLLNFKDEYCTSRHYVPEHLRLHGGNRRRVDNGGLEVRHEG